MNAPFPVFCIPVEGREKTFKARALTMKQAAEWCPMVVGFTEELQRATGLNQYTRYEVLASLQEKAIDLLKACPTIEQSDRVDWDALTYEQLLAAIDEIFEVSDPFARAHRIKMEAVEKQTRAIEAMGKAGVDISKFMPSPGDLGSPSLG